MSSMADLAGEIEQLQLDLKYYNNEYRKVSNEIERLESKKDELFQTIMNLTLDINKLNPKPKKKVHWEHLYYLVSYGIFLETLVFSVALTNILESLFIGFLSILIVGFFDKVIFSGLLLFYTDED